MSLTLPPSSGQSGALSATSPSAAPAVPGRKLPGDPAALSRDPPSAAPALPGATDVGVTGSVAPSPVAPAAQRAIESLFIAGGQVPLAPPPEGPSNDPAIRTLASKSQMLLDAAENGSGGESSPPTAGEAGVGSSTGPRYPATTLQFSMTALLRAFLQVVATEFKEQMVEGQQDLQLKVADLGKAADDMMAAAKKRLVGSLATGAGSILLGGFGVISAGINLRGTFKANADLAKAGVPLGQQGLEFQKLTAEWSSAANFAQSAGQMLQGGMQILQGQEEAGAAIDDANKAKDEKASVTDEALYNNASNLRQQFTQTLQDILEKEKSWEQSQDQSANAITHNI